MNESITSHDSFAGAQKNECFRDRCNCELFHTRRRHPAASPRRTDNKASTLTHVHPRQLCRRRVPSFRRDELHRRRYIGTNSRHDDTASKLHGKPGANTARTSSSLPSGCLIDTRLTTKGLSRSSSPLLHDGLCARPLVLRNAQGLGLGFTSSSSSPDVPSWRMNVDAQTPHHDSFTRHDVSPR